MNERVFCKAMVALMVGCLPCVFLIPAVRTGAAAWPFAIALALGIGINLLYLWLREQQMLSFFGRPGLLRKLIKFYLLSAPLLYVVGFPFFDASLRRLPFFKDAVHVLETSDAAKNDIGLPLKVGWPVEGSIEETPDSGHSILEIPVFGSRDGGTLRVVSTKAKGLWKINELTLILRDGTVRDLLAKDGQGRPGDPAEGPG